MKRLLVLVSVLFAFALQVNANVVISSDLVAFDDQIISQNQYKANELDLAEHKISQTINEIKAEMEARIKEESKTQEVIADIDEVIKKEVEEVKKVVDIVKEAPVATEINEEVPPVIAEINEEVPPVIAKTEEVITKTVIKEVKETKVMEEKVIESKEMAEVKEEKKEEATKNKEVILHTEKGDITILLYLDKAPITAGNFLDLVQKKFYNGLTFHRLISGFMIQGGCPLGNGTGNYVDPETNKPRYIKHESHPDLKHDKEGVVAMARTSDPDSASSQFFIDLGPQPFLNAGGADPYGYAVFGQVVAGMDVVHKIMDENVAPYPGSDGTSNPVKIKSAEVVK